METGSRQAARVEAGAAALCVPLSTLSSLGRRIADCESRARELELELNKERAHSELLQRNKRVFEREVGATVVKFLLPEDALRTPSSFSRALSSVQDAEITRLLEARSSGGAEAVCAVVGKRVDPEDELELNAVQVLGEVTPEERERLEPAAASAAMRAASCSESSSSSSEEEEDVDVTSLLSSGITLDQVLSQHGLTKEVLEMRWQVSVTTHARAARAETEASTASTSPLLFSDKSHGGMINSDSPMERLVSGAHRAVRNFQRRRMLWTPLLGEDDSALTFSTKELLGFGIHPLSDADFAVPLTTAQRERLGMLGSEGDHWESSSHVLLAVTPRARILSSGALQDDVVASDFTAGSGLSVHWSPFSVLAESVESADVFFPVLLLTREVTTRDVERMARMRISTDLTDALVNITSRPGTAQPRS